MNVFLQGGYESYGDYEPHTGDPQYDLEYDRSYYKMPEMVKYVTLFSQLVFLVYKYLQYSAKFHVGIWNLHLGYI